MAVFTGGTLGGLARYAVTWAWPESGRGVLWSVFTVNTAGAFLLGLLVAVLAQRSASRRYLRPLLGTGFLGAFTTFSAVVARSDQLAEQDGPWTAGAYLIGGTLAALTATALGLLIGRTLAGTAGSTAGDQ